MEIPVTDLFAAAIIPGILLATLMRHTQLLDVGSIQV